MAGLPHHQTEGHWFLWSVLTRAIGSTKYTRIIAPVKNNEDVYNVITIVRVQKGSTGYPSTMAALTLIKIGFEAKKEVPHATNLLTGTHIVELMWHKTRPGFDMRCVELALMVLRYCTLS